MNSFSISPFLKWAGGKRSLLPELHSIFPDFTGTYIEPFVGAGSVLFSMEPSQRKIANDYNSGLIEVYVTVRDQVEELIEVLHRFSFDKSSYYEIRSWDRDPIIFDELSPVDRAARFIYLNRTCYNGLFRVNSKGHFNVPIGSYKNPDFVVADKLRAVSQFLNTKVRGKFATKFTSGDYRAVTKLAKQGDFLYFDPPYDPLSLTSKFTNYSDLGFDKNDQLALRDEILRLTDLSIPVVLSNSSTQFIRELYKDTSVFKISEIKARRNIGSTNATRILASELIISNVRGCGVQNKE